MTLHWFRWIPKDKVERGHMHSIGLQQGGLQSFEAARPPKKTVALHRKEIGRWTLLCDTCFIALHVRPAGGVCVGKSQARFVQETKRLSEPVRGGGVCKINQGQGMHPSRLKSNAGWSTCKMVSCHATISMALGRASTEGRRTENSNCMCSHQPTNSFPSFPPSSAEGLALVSWPQGLKSVI